MKIPIDIKTGNVKIDQESKEIIVGIDLGTTNSLVAYIDNGIPKVILDEIGSHALLPSIIHFTQDGNILVGNEAKNELKNHPDRTIKSVKRLMGKSYADIKDFTKNTTYEIIDGGLEELVKIKMDDKFYSPVELSAEILKSLKRRAEKQLQSTINKAVITVPAYFNDTQRQATRDAGKLAGLDVLRIINEPTAASLAYGLGLKADEKEIIAVYDFGGGTFDVSILQLENGIFEVLSTHGDTDLGGDDIDHAIVDFWLKNFPDVRKNLLKIGGLSRLVSLAEECKIILSNQSNFEYKFEDGIFVQLNQTALHEIILSLIKKTLEACESAIRDAKIIKKEINKVILVGGTTRIPIIKKSLHEFFGIPPFDSLNPDETVALGAAIQADILAGNRKDILLLDVTPLSLGIETIGGLMDVIIPRNSKIPHKAGRQYTTSVDGQKNLKISIYQGERDLVENNRKLGEFILKNIPPMPAGFPKLEIQFLIDADGILKVRAKELRSETVSEIEISATYGISEEKMAEMLLESIKNAEEDARLKSLIEAKVEAKNILLSTEKFLVQNADIMNQVEKDRMRVLSEELKQSVEKNNKDDIEVIMKNLNDFASPIAQKAMDTLLSRTLQGKTIDE